MKKSRSTLLQSQVVWRYFLYSPKAIDQKIKHRISDLYARCGKQMMYQQLNKMRILSFGSHILSELQHDRDYWEQVHDRFVKRNNYILETLRCIQRALGNKARDVCVYENFGALLRSGSCIGCFESSDVDLTGSLDDQGEIDRAMRSSGFIKKERRHEVNQDILTCYYNPEILENGLWINVAWRPIARRCILHNNRLCARLDKARKCASNVGRCNIRVLSNDELMYFCILHIALGHYYMITPGVRLYVDVDRMARNCEISWDKILEWSKEDGMGIRVLAVLHLCRDLLGTPIDFFVPSKDKPCLNKLMAFLRDKSTGQYAGHPSRLARAYVDLISDNMHPVRSAINRLFFIKSMKGSHDEKR